jgi:hypothetical protein
VKVPIPIIRTTHGCHSPVIGSKHMPKRIPLTVDTAAAKANRPDGSREEPPIGLSERDGGDPKPVRGSLAKASSSTSRVPAARLFITGTPKAEWFPAAGSPASLPKAIQFHQSRSAVRGVLCGISLEAPDALVELGLVPPGQTDRLPSHCDARQDWQTVYRGSRILGSWRATMVARVVA